MPMSNPDAADLFLAEAQAADPERYAALEALYPMSSENDDFRFKHGEPRKRALRRLGLSNGVPREMRKPMSDDDRKAREEWLPEWRLDYALAKEQAETG